MLLFYAVECGLKHLLVRKSGLTACPKDHGDPLFSHDLAKILRALRPTGVEAMTLLRSIPRLRLLGSTRDYHSFYDIHLAWRYGLQVDPTSAKAIETWLHRLARLIVEREIDL